MRRRWGRVVLCALAATVSGCAAMAPRPETAMSASSSDERRVEIARLEGEIAHRRDELGLAEPTGEAQTFAPPPVAATSDTRAEERPPAAAAPMAGAAPGAHAPAAPATAAPPAPTAPAEAPSPPPPPPPSPVIAPRDAVTESARESVITSSTGTAETGPYRSTRCREVKASADDICHASDRICAIAASLGDGDSARSCARAKEDCQNARRASSSCK